MSYNPYSAPVVRTAGPATQAAAVDDFVTRRMITVAGESRLWTLVLGGLLFLLVGLAWLAIVLADQHTPRILPDEIHFAELFGRLLGVFINYGLPGILLVVVSQRLSHFVQRPHSANLLAALKSQRVYWTVLGGLSLLWAIGLIVTVSSWFVSAESEIEMLRQMTQ